MWQALLNLGCVALLAEDNSAVGHEQQYEVCEDDSLPRSRGFGSRPDYTIAGGHEAALDVPRSCGVPGEGTSQKQSQDEGECYAWSKGQTGVDPMAPPPATAPSPAQEASAPPPGGQRARGAARGAAAGAVIGEVADDDAGKGAAIGATAGGLKGGAEKRQQQAQAQQEAAKKQQEATQQQQAATQEQLKLFKNGFGACLESKGYTVK